MPKSLEKLNRLSLDAARFMATNGLVIRNSFTEQVQSLHYGVRSFPETHTAGAGRYCIPLWTGAIKDLGQDADGIREKINLYIDYRSLQIRSLRQKIELSSELDPFPFDGVESLDPSLLTATPLEQSRHLDEFVVKIKEHIGPYAPFGQFFNGLFNYELLVSSDRLKCVDKHGLYSTGGRSMVNFNSNTIWYRATLNQFEINFVKEVLCRKFDERIPGIELERDIKVADSARYVLCNELCANIISAKLVSFLNACDKPGAVITLSRSNLEVLLERALKTQQEEINRILTKKLILGIRTSTPPERYLTSHKYPEPYFFKNVSRENPEEIQIKFGVP